MNLTDLILKNAPKKIEVLQPSKPTSFSFPTIDNDQVKLYELKKQLSDTNDVFIETIEAQITNKDLPYSEQELKDVSDYRDGIREIINNLEVIS